MAQLVVVITDSLPVEDDVCPVCTGCGRPELFCDCPREVKRALEGWDE